MALHTRRHLDLLEQSKALHRYARTLQSDINASSMLVHRTLAKAFSEGAGTADVARLKDDLRRAFDASRAAGRA